MRILLGLLIVLCPTIASATDYWISPGASDATACGSIDSVEATPPTDPGVYRGTTMGAKGCMVGGDRIIAKGGTYASGTVNTGMEFYNPPSGTASNYTVLMADPAGSRPVFNINGAGFQRGAYCDTGNCNYIEIRGITFNTAYDCVKLTMAPPQTRWSHHWHYVDNICHDTVDNGILTDTSLDTVSPLYQGGDHLIEQNEFYNIGSGSPNYVPGMLVIYNTGNRSIIQDNYLHDSTNGIGIWHDHTPLQNVIVRRNRLWRMGRPDLHAWIGAPTAMLAVEVPVPGGGHQIYNNLVWDSGGVPNPGGGQFAAFIFQTQTDSTTTVLVANNTVYNLISPSAKCLSVDMARDPAGILFKNNICYLTGGTSGGVLSNNLTTNPLFVSASDLHLQAGSAAIDTGLNLSGTFTTDYANTVRPQGSGWEIGAYEYIPGGAGDTTPPATPSGLRVQ